MSIEQRLSALEETNLKLLSGELRLPAIKPIEFNSPRDREIIALN